MQNETPSKTGHPFRLQRMQGAEAMPLTDDRQYCASIIQVGDRFPGALLPETLRKTLYMPLDDGKPLLTGMPSEPLYGTGQATFCRRLVNAVPTARSKRDYTLHSLSAERPMTLERNLVAFFYLVFMKDVIPAIGSIHHLCVLDPPHWLYKPHHPRLARFMHPVPGLSRDMTANTLDRLLQRMRKAYLV